MKVLVFGVESPRARRPIERALARLGHETFAANDCDAAIAIIGREGVRVVIADGRFPKFAWIELCRQLRKAESGARVHFILIESDDVDESHEEWAIEAGVDDFLGRPSDPLELRRRLRAAARATPAADAGRAGFVCQAGRNFGENWLEA